MKAGNQVFMDEDSVSVLPEGRFGLNTNGSVSGALLGSSLEQHSVADHMLPTHLTYDRNLELSRNARSLPHMPWHEAGGNDSVAPHMQQQMPHSNNSHFQPITHHQSQPNFMSNNSYLPEGSFNQSGLDQRSYSPQQYQPQPTMDSSVIFDPRMLAAKDTAGHNFQFKVSIDELDVWDLLPVHTLVKNSPSVSAACGKWNAISSVSLISLLV